MVGGKLVVVSGMWWVVRSRWLVVCGMWFVENVRKLPVTSHKQKPNIL